MTSMDKLMDNLSVMTMDTEEALEDLGEDPDGICAPAHAMAFLEDVNHFIGPVPVPVMKQDEDSLEVVLAWQAGDKTLLTVHFCHGREPFRWMISSEEEQSHGTSNPDYLGIPGDVYRILLKLAHEHFSEGNIPSSMN